MVYFLLSGMCIYDSLHVKHCPHNHALRAWLPADGPDVRLWKILGGGPR